MSKPVYIMVAGVNGAGKSTLYRAFPELFSGTKRLNADEILKKEKLDWKKDSDNMKAMRILVDDMKEYFREGISFHHETTLSGSEKGHVNRVMAAKEIGYEVKLYYVGLDSAELAIQRVQQRVEKGGHGVSEPVIKKRYDKSLLNLKGLVNIVDEVRIFDNSKEFKEIYTRVGSNVIWNDTTYHSWMLADYPTKIQE